MVMSLVHVTLTVTCFCFSVMTLVQGKLVVGMIISAFTLAVPDFLSSFLLQGLVFRDLSIASSNASD